MKSQLSNLEAEFILYKENNQNAISELSVSIEKKDEEINYLKDEIMALKSAGKEKQQIISDLTVNQLQMKQDINAMNKRCKKNRRKKHELIKNDEYKTKRIPA
jgi:predicted  nucleic acid-binding Zn-ribbon protein